MNTLKRIAKPMYKKLFTLFISLAACYALNAQLSPQVDSIPMSDGKKLAADVYIPQGMSSGPVILIQTPYNRQLYRFNLPLGIGLNINSSNYILVIADWRGFYGSAAAAYVGAPGMGKDGYSAVEWIYQQSWCNGKIGTWGPSALGRVQFQTAKENPPHLTCICPLVAGPQYDYVEYFPNGDLRTEYVQQLDGLGFGLSPLLMQHPVHDLTWTYVENLNDYPDSIFVPCFMIGGWYDHTVEFMLPFFSEIQTQSPQNVRSKHRLLMGPWVHGGHGVAQVGTQPQGQLMYPAATGWSDSLALVHFDYYLRNINNGWDASPAVQYFQMGEDAWHSAPAWPAGGTNNVNFYFHKDGSLNNNVPPNNGDTLLLSYNPTDPSPTVGGPTLRADLQQGPYDQAPLVESRGDILTFTTNTLAQDVVMRGQGTVHLSVSSNKFDTDFDVRFTDVYPDGRSMLLADGAMRMRFRNGVTAADTMLMTPGQVYNIAIKLPNTCITFLAGHKIRIDVTSSNYPRFNRNANTGGPMYPANSMDSLVNPVTATNTVYTNSINASFITLPLIGYNSLAKPTEEAAFSLYPNPCKDILHISPADKGAYTLRIYNLTGQQLRSFSGNGDAAVNLGNLPAATYMAELSFASGETLRKKLVKE